MEQETRLPPLLENLTCMGMSNIRELVDFIKDPSVTALLFADGLPQHMLLAMTEVVLDLDHDEFAKMFRGEGVSVVLNKLEEARTALNLEGIAERRLMVDSIENMCKHGLEQYVSMWREGMGTDTGPNFLIFFDPDVKGMLERVTGKPLDSFILDRNIQ